MPELKQAARSLPVIDVSALRSTQPDDWLPAAREINQACRQYGFFYVSGHGVDADLIADVQSMARRFFDLPEESRQRLSILNSSAKRGYEGLGTQALGESGEPDLKESFYLGPEPDPTLRPEACGFGQGPNQWPEDLPDFRPIMQRYIEEMLGFAARLMNGMGAALNLPEGYFAPFLTDPLARLRLLHYPPSPDIRAPLNGTGAHTDFGGLTILLQDDVGGLQVLDLDTGAWIDAHPLPDTFVINLGDLIARWTNDHYRSTLHRVLNVSGHRRFSVPFFLHGNVKYEVSCIASCTSSTDPSRYLPVTVESHYKDRFTRSRA